MPELNEKCRNCNSIITETYCGYCGQKRFVRIDLKFILSELQYTLVHTNKGFLYSLKRLIVNPGKTARGFIDGSRVMHYKPILLSFILSGISVIVFNALLTGFGNVNKTGVEVEVDWINFIALPTSWMSFVYLMLLPVFSFPTFIALRRYGHNYFEHIVLNSYILSYYILIQLSAVIVLFGLFGGSPEFYLTIRAGSYFLIPFLLTWFYNAVYTELTRKQLILAVIRVISYVLLLYVFITAFISLSLMLYAYFAGKGTLNVEIK